MAKPRAIPKSIRDIAEKIVREFQPEKIILFGSYAWGTPGPDSDVDLFIVKSGLQEPKHFRTTVIDRILDRHARTSWDALVYTPEEVEERLMLGDFLTRRIFQDGRVLYERHVT